MAELIFVELQNATARPPITIEFVDRIYAPKSWRKPAFSRDAGSD